MVQANPVPLSKKDNINDSEDNEIVSKTCAKIYIYEYNKYEDGEIEYLFAENIAESNDPSVIYATCEWHM